MLGILPKPQPVLSDAAAVEAFFAQVCGLAKAAREYSFGMHRVDGVPAALAEVLQLILHEGPQTVPRIGRARSTSRQNIRVLVNRMVAENWVELVENPAHKRSALVQLTEQGIQLARSATEREVGLHRLIIPGVNVDDLEKTTALLARLRQILTTKKGVPPVPDRASPVPDRKSSPDPESVAGAENYELPVNVL